MTILLTAALFVLVLLAPLSRTGAAHELTLFAGSMQDTETGKPSYAWQLEFRSWMTERAAFSLSYLNEGHVPYHHRDGGALQAWTRMPVMVPRLSLAGGIGPYYYFDSTMLPPDRDYANEHGWGLLGSVALTWFSERWQTFHIRWNVIKTGSLDTQSVLAGVGYQFDVQPWLSRPAGPTTPTGNHLKNELTVLAGRTIVNSFESEHALASSVEYRRRLARHLEATAALTDEGKNERIDRSGGTVQLWLVKDLFDDRASVGVGGGGYSMSDRRHASADAGNYFLTGIASMTASWRVAELWRVRITWSRVRTHYHRDTDVIIVGPGYLF